MPADAGDRGQYHAEGGRALVDQGDVDAELAVALDELAGAVQRVDQPVRAPVATLLPWHLRRFLGQDRKLRGQLLQALFDHLVGGQVGRGDRAVVILDPHVEATGIHLHDGLSGFLGDGDGRLAQVRGQLDHRAPCSHWRAMNSAASERPSEKSSRSISWSSSARFHGTTSSSSGSSPGSVSG
ncbi:hypothetical protein G6F40_014699 [Rhizopus arrhizus]|nr:hypothetical protein G6F40_014699 [Rhizopus arrhizus]